MAAATILIGLLALDLFFRIQERRARRAEQERSTMTFGQKIGAWARAHCGCSVHHNEVLYLESVAPPVDRVPGNGERYFLAGPSTCALYASRALADGGGLTDRELIVDYTTEIGTAVANVQTVCARRKAWIAGAPDPASPFCEGDIVEINGPPYGVHVIVVSGDHTVQPDGSWAGPTCQGGQADGGVEAFASTWHWKGGKLYAGTGLRNVVGYARAESFDTFVDPSGPADDTTSPAAQ